MLGLAFFSFVVRPISPKKNEMMFLKKRRLITKVYEYSPIFFCFAYTEYKCNVI